MAEASTSTTINLHNDITVNGKRYSAGQKVEVPKDQAEDISRMDYDHEQYKATLHQKRNVTHSAGTIAMGGGAQ